MSTPFRPLRKGCQATAWVLGVYHAHDYILGHMSEKAQEEVYTTSPHQAVAAVIGPRGKAVRKSDGGYVLSGFWPFASGNAASDWLLLGAEVFDENNGKLDEGDLLVPVSDIIAIDDWHVAGLQGTGSNSVKCTNVAVPAHRFVSLPAILENQTPAFARAPIRSDDLQVPGRASFRHVHRDVHDRRGEIGAGGIPQGRAWKEGDVHRAHFP